MSAASEAKIIKGNLLLILLKTKLMKSERYKKFKNVERYKNIVSEGGNGNKGFGKTMSSII